MHNRKKDTVMEKELLTLADALNYVSVSVESASPSGSSFVYRTHQPDPESNGWIHKCILNLRGQERELTGEILGSPIFADEETLLYTVKAGDTEYRILRVRGGNTEILGAVPYALAVCAVLDENRLLLRGSVDLVVKRAVDGGEAGEEAFAQRSLQREDCIIADEFPYWTNGVGDTNKHRNLVYLFDRSKGLVPVTEDTFNTQSLAVDVAGEKLYLTGGAYTVEKPLRLECREITLAEPMESRTLFAEEKWVPGELGFGGGRLVFSYRDPDSGNTVIAAMEPDSREVRKLAELEESLGHSVMCDVAYGGGKLWQVTDAGAWFVCTWQDHSDLYFVSLTGEKKRLTGAEGTVNNFHVAQGCIYFTAMQGMDHQELFFLDRQTGETKCISDFNRTRYANKIIQPMEKHSWRDSYGFEIYGYVIYPVGYKKGRKYPAILDIHGGPAATYGPIYYHEMQYWAAQGYFVVMANPTGGTGRGSTFSRIIGGTGRNDYEDIMGWLDMILEKIPDIDQKRLGVTGGSYGGFMTNWIIGHTDRFAAAASQRSTANNITESATKDFANRFVRIYTDPTAPDRYEKLWELSPLKYIDKSITKTPTLFLHGMLDYTCHHVEALQMYAALQYAGVPTKMILFREEAHGLSRAGRPRNRLRRLGAITEWMDKYLKTEE